VIGKAEVLSAGDNPRFIVSNLPVEGFKRYTNRALFSSTPLNEAFFCPRGEMTNRRAAGAQFGSRHAQHAFSGEQPTASVASSLSDLEIKGVHNAIIAKISFKKIK